MRALRQVTDRAAARGESPPDPGTIADAVLGPLYRRALWGALPADPAYASSLVDRLLSPASHNGANT
jgi:Tetracyclin repressor-like, C-terminal domain